MATVVPPSLADSPIVADGGKIDKSIAHGEFYERPRPAGPRSLIVFCHGMALLSFRHPASRTASFAGLLGRLLREAGAPFDCSDFLPFEFDNTARNLKYPEEIAEDLAERIEQIAIKKKYASIYLIGHSTGSLLVRGAILAARSVRDAGHSKRHLWVEQVKRLVLMANSNRGFEVVRCQVADLGDISGLLRLLIGVLQFTGVWDILPRLRLFRISTGTYRDSPWVRDLRLGWLRCFEDTAQHGPFLDAPSSVQIFGTVDQLVGDDDTQDVYLFGRTKVVRLKDFAHSTFLQFPPPDEDKKELVAPFDAAYQSILDAFREDVAEVTPPREQTRSGIVFLIHGIRDYADWQENLGYEIRKLAEGSQLNCVEVVHVRYGYFNVFQFPFIDQRLRCVRAFADAYYQARTRFPYVKEADIHVLAHSNGTFVLAEAMRQHREIRFNRVILCGSVLPRGFDWGLLWRREQVRDIHNDCANRDWPVGWLCRGLSILTPLGLGTAGYSGFETFHYWCRPFIRNNFLKGDHGAGLKVDRHESVARHLLGTASLRVAKRPSKGGLFDTVHALCVLMVPILLLFYVLLIPMILNYLYPKGMNGWYVLLASVSTLISVYLVSRI